jgi:hypothetical protein
LLVFFVGRELIMKVVVVSIQSHRVKFAISFVSKSRRIVQGYQGKI